jgi:predicted ester cyclase
MVVEGDKVAVRYTCHGTHKGELNAIPQTNKPVTVTGMLIFRVSKGKIGEIWVNWDALGLMQQLGAIPTQN